MLRHSNLVQIHFSQCFRQKSCCCLELGASDGGESVMSSTAQGGVVGTCLAEKVGNKQHYLLLEQRRPTQVARSQGASLALHSLSACHFFIFPAQLKNP